MGALAVAVVAAEVDIPGEAEEDTPLAVVVVAGIRSEEAVAIHSGEEVVVDTSLAEVAVLHTHQ